MLIHWQSHQEYLFFLHETKIHLDSSQRTRLSLEFGDVREKLLRSFILMLMLGFSSLTVWLRKLKADSLLDLLIGCTPDSLPPLGSYFDFIDRLWTLPKAFQRTGRKDLFPKDKNFKPSQKPGKGKKLPNRHSGITDSLTAYALVHEAFPFHFEERLQQVFGVPHSSLPSGTDLSRQMVSPFPTMAPVSIPTPPLMVIKSVNALETASITSIDEDGTPLCIAGFRMVNWGYCKQKHSRKWRCPLACGK